MSETAPPEPSEYPLIKDDEYLYLFFDEVLDGNSVPDPSAFEVTVDEVSRTVNEVSILSENQKIVSLRLSSEVRGSAVTVSYTPPAMNQIKDLAGNAAASFSIQPASYRRPPSRRSRREASGRRPAMVR